MPRSVASDLGLHCLPMSHKKDSWLVWVKSVTIYSNSHYQTQQNQVYTVSISSVPFLKDTFERFERTEIADEIMVPTAYAIDRPPDKSAYFLIFPKICFVYPNEPSQ